MNPSVIRNLEALLHGHGDRALRRAAQVASKWSQNINESTLHALVQRTGQRAEQQAQSRYVLPPQERQPQRAASELAVLMADGA